MYATISVEMPELNQGWHVKLRPGELGERQTDEAARTRWAHDHLAVAAPDHARALRLPGISMLITKTLEGRPSYKYIEVLPPAAIIAGVSRAVDVMRQTDPTVFPFQPPHWATERGVQENLERLRTSADKHRELHPVFSSQSYQELKAIVDAGPRDEEIALAHGDLCMPNVLLDESANVAGIVDLGGIHVGDSKLDLAIMSLTVAANMGEKWERQLLAMHDTTPDDPGIQYNRLAYDLGLERPDPWAWIQTPALTAQRDRLAA